MHQEQVGFISGMESCKKKLIYLIHKIKEWKPHGHLSRQIKAFDKRLFMIKNTQQTSIRRERLDL